MPAKTHYFKLGLFLITGFLLAAAALIYFGAGTRFVRTVPAESYFNESVQGLSVGSPVKFRGVQVGSVSAIGFVGTKYANATATAARLVLVEMELRPSGVWERDDLDIHDYVTRLVDQGLRLRLTSQGLTGVVYLEADFYRSQATSLPDLGFTPESMFIPSTPSTMQRVEQALANIGSTLGKLEDIDYQQIGANVNRLLESLHSSIGEADIAHLSELAAQDLEELGQILHRANGLLADARLEGVLTDARAMTSHTRKLLADLDDPIRGSVENLRLTMANLADITGRIQRLGADPAMEAGVRSLPQLLGAAQNATIQLARSGGQMEALLAKLGSLTTSQRDIVDAILREAQSTLMNLNDLTEEATRNPARLLMGSPPTPATTSGTTGATP